MTGGNLAGRLCEWCIGLVDALKPERERERGERERERREREERERERREREKCARLGE